MTILKDQNLQAFVGKWLKLMYWERINAAFLRGSQATTSLYQRSPQSPSRGDLVDKVCS